MSAQQHLITCDKFITLFERRITEVIQAAPDQSVIYTDRYKKMLLLGKIMHKDYASMKVKSKTQLSYREYVQELQSFAASMESKSADTPAEKKSVNTTTTEEDKESKDKVTKVNQIENYPINGKGVVSYDIWNKLTGAERLKVIEKRNLCR